MTDERSFDFGVRPKKGVTRPYPFSFSLFWVKGVKISVSKKKGRPGCPLRYMFFFHLAGFRGEGESLAQRHSCRPTCASIGPIAIAQKVRGVSDRRTIGFRISL